ncbi:acetyl-CoA synthetase-like protein [Dacryopinax primogenitus]|uniref:Acetyl-CoA synthetase-like protein n=1 Tax=Dacryopinax primogenitus (strain DJM 731) TaxID=1858805 RepID=M5FUJ2_DACPD|nr:acetyl-CoA synthetase-like protein [Dacryopinax primogenitus]EJT96916.1 acetyl-CoA synthetase-like protein [Dacryopinax primogenitus]
MAGNSFDESPPSTIKAVLNTCVLPPLDGSIPFPQFVDYHLEKSHNHPFFELVGTGNDADETITWGEAARATLRLTAKLRKQVHVTEEQRKAGVIIAILANTDSLVYSTIVMAIMRAGFMVFPLSTRNSVPALEHLLQKTSSLYMFGSLPSQGTPATALQETTATYTDLYPRLSTNPALPYDALQDAVRTPDLPPVQSFPEYSYVDQYSPLVYLHSSGSTTFPKPIPMNHRFWMSVCRTMMQGGFETMGTRWGLMSLPVFHGMGIFLIIVSAAAHGTISVLFKPSSIPSIPSPEKVLECCIRGKVDYLFTVPSFCVAWSHNEESVKYLATLKGVIAGGGPLVPEIGDRLVQSGVNVSIVYGTTEVGLIFPINIIKDDQADWNYGQIYTSMRVNLIPEGDNIVRVVVLDSDAHPIAFCNQPEIKAFDTNDLLEQHPKRKNLCADDQIMMSNGEKTNPGPMENIIGGDPNVRSCMTFGRGRTQVGIAIEPAQPIDTSNEEEVAKFRNLIWVSVEKANKLAPQHSRIFKEFILIIDPRKKTFLRTPKGSLSRNASLKLFAEEIEGLYSVAEQPTKAEWAKPPNAWDESAIHEFVSRVVNAVIGQKRQPPSSIAESHDLFEQGCDSLQATYVRAAITNALRHASKSSGKSNIAATSVPHNLVYKFPTVKSLVAYLTKAITSTEGDDLPQMNDTSVIAHDMYSMIDKYTKDLPLQQPGPRTMSGEVVLLTGSTGALGTYLLQQLLLDERIQRVYAINRISTNHALLARQSEAFSDRGVDVKLLESPKLRLIETDVGAPNLGLSTELSNEICGCLTTTIHNAWRLDFNLSLSAFEPNVRSSRALVDLALQARGVTPTQFIFTSSVGTLTHWSESRPVPEELLPDPAIATGTGYSESKWVVERIILAAAQQRGLRATIWRVGQLAGSTTNGAWNTTDWLPLLVKSGEKLGVLPELRGVLSWLPTDKAAQSILDAMHSRVKDPVGAAEYLHLVHPHPVSSEVVMQSIASHQSCELVPFSEWVRKLEQAAEDHTAVHNNPAIKLLEFFRGVEASEASQIQHRDSGESGERYKAREAIGLADLETTKAEEKSQTLRELKPLGEADVQKWLHYWKNKGLLV